MVRKRHSDEDVLKLLRYRPKRDPVDILKLRVQWHAP